MRLKVTPESAQQYGWEETPGNGPEWSGWSASKKKKSQIQVDFRPTLLIKAPFFHSGQLSLPHEACWCENVDIQNNQLALLKVSWFANHILQPLQLDSVGSANGLF